MKIVFFTKYTKKGASSRLRTFQYIDYYEQQGIKCTIHPFFTDQYLVGVYQKKVHNKWEYIQSFLRRFLQLFTVFRYDKIVIEKELFPYFFPVFEWALSALGANYIVDYDDAIYHNYDQSSNKLIRLLLSSKISRVMKYASVVVVGNAYLQKKAIRSGARDVVIIPTVIDMDNYSVRPKATSGTFVIGWIGSPITAKYLPFLKPALDRIATEGQMTFEIVGVTRSLGLGAYERNIEWTEEGEIRCIQNFDVGIMPLEDNIWERGKCGYKLIQYMGCGIPVIGTPIGANDEIIQQGVNGYKATSIEDWHERIRRIMLLPHEERMAMGMSGRKIAEEQYSLQRYREVWLGLLKKKH